MSAYDSKYAQNQGACKGHWQGTPDGGTNPGKDKCWACKYGCAVLCLLAIKGTDPDEANIKANVNKSADCTWSGRPSQKTAPPPRFIAGIGGHFVIVVSEKDKDTYNIWDPDGGKDRVLPKKDCVSFH